MTEINKNKLKEIKEIVEFDEGSEYAKKIVRIIKDKKQYTIRIPKVFAQLVDINPEKDHFEFHLIPKSKEMFELEGILIKR